MEGIVKLMFTVVFFLVLLHEIASWAGCGGKSKPVNTDPNIYVEAKSATSNPPYNTNADNWQIVSGSFHQTEQNLTCIKINCGTEQGLKPMPLFRVYDESNKYVGMLQVVELHDSFSFCKILYGYDAIKSKLIANKKLKIRRV